MTDSPRSRNPEEAHMGGSELPQIDLKAAENCTECEGTGWVWEPCHDHIDFCPRDCNSDIPCGRCQEHMYA